MSSRSDEGWRQLGPLHTAEVQAIRCSCCFSRSCCQSLKQAGHLQDEDSLQEGHQLHAAHVRVGHWIVHIWLLQAPCDVRHCVRPQPDVHPLAAGACEARFRTGRQSAAGRGEHQLRRFLTPFYAAYGPAVWQAVMDRMPNAAQRILVLSRARPGLHLMVSASAGAQPLCFTPRRPPYTSSARCRVMSWIAVAWPRSCRDYMTM